MRAWAFTARYAKYAITEDGLYLLSDFEGYAPQPPTLISKNATYFNEITYRTIVDICIENAIVIDTRVSAMNLTEIEMIPSSLYIDLSSALASRDRTILGGLKKGSVSVGLGVEDPYDYRNTKKIDSSLLEKYKEDYGKMVHEFKKEIMTYHKTDTIEEALKIIMLPDFRFFG